MRRFTQQAQMDASNVREVAGLETVAAIPAFKIPIRWAEVNEETILICDAEKPAGPVAVNVHARPAKTILNHEINSYHRQDNQQSYVCCPHH